MTPPKKRSFFERLAGNLGFDDSEDFEEVEVTRHEKTISASQESSPSPKAEKQANQQVETAAELAVDVYQTPNDIIIQAMVAGVNPENLSINITRDVVTLKGKREENRTITQDGYLIRELYWGSFIRTIALPAEVEIEAAEALSKNGMLMIKLPKLDKYRQTMLKVKTI